MSRPVELPAGLVYNQLNKLSRETPARADVSRIKKAASRVTAASVYAGGDRGDTAEKGA